MKKLVLGLFLAWVSLAGAQAHELIIKPSSTSASGDVLPMALYSTHVFIAKEEVEDASRINAGVFGVADNLLLAPGDGLLAFDAPVSKGTAIITAVKDGGIWSVTNEGGMAGSRGELESRGLKVLRASKNDKYAKMVVNPSEGDSGFSAVVGHELEIVPMGNPATAKVGDLFEVKLLLRGQPLSAPVWATRDGFSDIPNTYAYYTESGADGVAKIKLTEPGLWMVRTLKEEQAPKDGGYDVRSLRAVLTFGVK
ncbi:MAG: DUF4198 domain-containing protein [Synergistaceae bacterium]|nr:DUF4198 domain-containing protein [Synergistaceae bacterium]